MKTTQMTKKAMSADVSIDPDDERTLVITASTAAVDRENEVLIPQGCNSKNWEKNPVIHFNHMIWELPVGTGVAIKRSDDAVRIKLKLVSRPPTYPANLDWLPDTLFWMYKEKAMRGASVGFLPRDGRIASPRDKTKYGEDCQYIHSRWELLELTLCPIGCNQEALAEAVSKGIMSQETADSLISTKSEGEIAESPAEKSENDETQVVDTGDDATDDADDENHETGTCATCGKEFPKAEMTMNGDDYVCGGCADLNKSAPEPEVKEITREIAPAKRVAAVVEVSAPEVPVVKHVHRFIEPPAPEVAVKTRKAVVRTMAKLRGAVWVDED